MISPALDQNRSEWLEADGLGGFASGTVCGLRTRRYHALLLAATTPPSGRMVLVNGFDATIESGGEMIPISKQRYLPGIDAPDGPTTLENFATEPWPQWTWTLPSGEKIVQEIFVPHGQSNVVVRWHVEKNSDGALQLQVRPFFSGRDFHALHHENPNFGFTPENIPFGQRWRFYPGVPPVVARTNGIYHHEPTWYRNFLYDEERERGLDYVEDLAAPGRYVFDLRAGPAVLIFSAESEGEQISAAQDVPALAQELAEKETRRRAAFPTPHLRAADAYLVNRGTGKTIIAGYPWFGDWGRDTFISMRGLCLATGRLEEARKILVAWSGLVSEGMLPNRFPDVGGQPEYNSVDASLWYVIVAHEFLDAVKQDAQLSREKEALLAAVDAILTGYTAGTRFGIRADTDGLLACGVPGQQLTWMDAKVDDWVVTPRNGQAGRSPGALAQCPWPGCRLFPALEIFLRKGPRRFRTAILE